MLPEFGGVEVLLIAALALIVVGPKDLPVLLRKVGKFVGKMRGMANEFRASFDEMARQSELDELRKEVEAMRLAQTYDPTGLVPGAYGAPSSYEPPAPQDHSFMPAPVEPLPPEPPAEAPVAPRRARTAKTAKATDIKPAKAAKPATRTKPAAKPRTSGKGKPAGSGR